MHDGEHPAMAAAHEGHGGRKTSGGGHAGHDRHAGHTTGMFRNRFWVSLVLSAPVVPPGSEATELWNIVRRLIREAWNRYRWESRPSRHRGLSTKARLLVFCDSRPGRIGGIMLRD